MDSVSNTAFFCCGARMVDAENKHPLCGDRYAKSFMDEDGMTVFLKFRKFSNAITANAMRHRIIDDLVLQELEKDRNTLCIIVGCGFDTRAFRFTGGTWVEVDEPDLMARKERRLPAADCTNNLIRVEYDYTKHTLESVLPKQDRSQKVLVIVEGVFIYMDDDGKRKLIRSLQALFPEHVLLCDLQSFSFYRAFNRKFQEVLQNLGTSMKLESDHPEELFLENGYTLNGRTSILDTVFLHRKREPVIALKKLVINTLYRDVKNGYSVFSFSYNG